MGIQGLEGRELHGKVGVNNLENLLGRCKSLRRCVPMSRKLTAGRYRVLH